MKIKDIERLVEMIKEAGISELSVTSGDSTVRLRKALRAAPAHPPKHEEATAQAPPEGETLPREEPEEVAAPVITAPMVGIFHSIETIASAGVTLKKGQPVGAIESMKLMNDVVSDCDGVIAEVLVEDGMPVEYGQALFRLVSTEA